MQLTDCETGQKKRKEQGKESACCIAKRSCGSCQQPRRRKEREMRDYEREQQWRRKYSLSVKNERFRQYLKGKNKTGLHK